MAITIHHELEARLRDRAKAAGISLETYIERIAQQDQAAEEELEGLAGLALEGLNSGDPFTPGPDYWAEQHRRLDERLRKNGER